MFPELTKGMNNSITFLGVCKHCDNATLLHILELNIQTCAFCHQEDLDTDSIEHFEHKQVKSDEESVSTIIS